MSEEFRTISVIHSRVEDELNRLGVEGWQAINCWPGGSGQTICVLKRTIEYFCRKTKSFQPCRPLYQLDLEFALARCLEQPDNPLGKNKGVRLSDLGREFGADEMAVFEHLKKAGLLESDKLPGAHSAFHDHHLLYVSHPEENKAPLWLNVKKFKKKAVHPKAAQESTMAPEPPAKVSPPDGAPTIQDMIAHCMKQTVTKPGYPHSILLGTMAKHFGVDLQTIHQIINSAGVPDEPSNPKTPFVKVAGAFVGLKKWNEKFYFNVRPKPQNRG